jgi:hypothetical protein
LVETFNSELVLGLTATIMSEMAGPLDVYSIYFLVALGVKAMKYLFFIQVSFKEMLQNFQLFILYPI